jgi:hypothetical protein
MVLYLFAPRSRAETAFFAFDLVKILTIKRWIEAGADKVYINIVLCRVRHS